MTAFMQYVKELYGPGYVEITQPSMEEIYQNTDAHTPIIFILSPGADPT